MSPAAVFEGSALSSRPMTVASLWAGITTLAANRWTVLALWVMAIAVCDYSRRDDHGPATQPLKSDCASGYYFFFMRSVIAGGIHRRMTSLADFFILKSSPGRCWNRVV